VHVSHHPKAQIYQNQTQSHFTDTNYMIEL